MRANRIIGLWLAAFVFIGITAASRQMEDLDRGIIAIKQTDLNIYIGWRSFATDPADIAFNVYRGQTKLNTTPITNSTNYIDTTGTLSDVYYIRPVIDGQEKGCSQTVSVWANNYLDIPVQQVPNDPNWTYTINDAAAGDLDGDGQYEIIVKRLPPAIGVGQIVMIEAYKMDGAFLWRISMGPNFTEWEELNQIVYDFNGDGRAEIALKTSELTTFGDGIQIGDTNGDGITNYSSSAVYNGTRLFMTQGPEFLSIIDGQTGIELARTNYITRDPLVQWGKQGQSTSQLAHRSYKFHMTPAYIDGQRPSLVICRGIYERMKMEAWNYRNGTLQQIWTWDSVNESDPNYNGQGNHNFSVGDVDQDGKDEIAYGGCMINDNGTGLYSTGLDHGDAMHLSDMDPTRPGLELWRCLEWADGKYGTEFRDAGTGQNLIRYFATKDTGRACAGDIDPRYVGYELWGSTGCPLYSCSGTVIRTSSPSVMNFMVWWDGDLLRELVDHNWDSVIRTGPGRIDKWDYENNVLVTQLTAAGTYSCNDTKGTPVLSADLFGDWREEIIWRTQDNRNMRLYTTTIPTQLRIYTLMHDPQYRLAIAWQVCAYNQPPHPGFYLGDGMTLPAPTPDIVLAHNRPQPDPSGDCCVNLVDFSLMAENWLATNCSDANNGCGAADLNFSGTVDTGDVSVIASYWLQQVW